MKKLLVLLMVLFAFAAQAQTDEFDTVPPFKKTNKIPDFAILRTDSTWFTNKQLPQNKPFVLIYFAPDCGHCQLTAQEFVKDMDKLKNIELVWVSSRTPEQIKEFAEAYKLNQFSNVVMGRDPNYKLVPFYKIEFTPFMAVYDKRGKFLNSYPQGTNPETITKLIKNGK
jgi:peroxiredoxin